MRGHEILMADSRLEVFTADGLTGHWISFALRVAGTIVVTDQEPMSALVYALSGGIKPPVIVACPARFRANCKHLEAAGATACIVLPFKKRDVDRAWTFWGREFASLRWTVSSGFFSIRWPAP